MHRGTRPRGRVERVLLKRGAPLATAASLYTTRPGAPGATAATVTTALTSTIAASLAAAIAAATIATAATAVHEHDVHGACDQCPCAGGVRRHTHRKSMPGARRRRRRSVGQPLLCPLGLERPMPERPKCLVGRVPVVLSAIHIERVGHHCEHFEAQSVLLGRGQRWRISTECFLESIQWYGLVRRGVCQ